MKTNTILTSKQYRYNKKLHCSRSERNGSLATNSKYIEEYIYNQSDNIYMSMPSLHAEVAVTCSYRSRRKSQMAICYLFLSSSHVEVDVTWITNMYKMKERKKSNIFHCPRRHTQHNRKSTVQIRL